MTQVTQSLITSIAQSLPAPTVAGRWVQINPVTVASGSGATTETTIPLSPTITIPTQTIAVCYAMSILVGGGTGKASLTIQHAPGQAEVGRVEASAQISFGVYANPVVDINGGRLTYAVIFTSSPTSVTWTIKVTGLFRSAR